MRIELELRHGPQNSALDFAKSRIVRIEFLALFKTTKRRSQRLDKDRLVGIVF